MSLLHPTIDRIRQEKWRIKRRGTNDYHIQRRVLWFWLDWTEYGFYSLEDARKCFKTWQDYAGSAGSGVSVKWEQRCLSQ